MRVRDRQKIFRAIAEHLRKGTSIGTILDTLMEKFQLSAQQAEDAILAGQWSLDQKKKKAA